MSRNLTGSSRFYKVTGSPQMTRYIPTWKLLIKRYADSISGAKRMVEFVLQGKYTATLVIDIAGLDLFRVGCNRCSHLSWLQWKQLPLRLRPDKEALQVFVILFLLLCAQGYTKSLQKGAVNFTVLFKCFWKYQFQSVAAKTVFHP